MPDASFSERNTQQGQDASVGLLLKMPRGLYNRCVKPETGEFAAFSGLHRR